MLKRDFIMAQIEEITKVILRLIQLRTTDNPARQATLISEAYSGMKIDRNYLLQTDPEAICTAFDEGNRSGIQRMEMAVKIMIEDSYANPEEKKHLLRKAKQMLEYIEANDNTFSLERIDTLNEIKNLLA